VNEIQLEVPFIPEDEIRLRAQDFLKKYYPSNIIPIDIERIVEFELGISIIPVAGLKLAFDIDGWISNDLKSITVDNYEYEKEINRCRFTIAHEVGHFVLHRKIFEQLEFLDIYGWKYFVNNFNPKQYSWLETQANIFAGHVLIPNEHIGERYKKVTDKVREEGFDIQFDLDSFNQYVCRWMAQEFNVSFRPMEIRLKKEGYI